MIINAIRVFTTETDFTRVFLLLYTLMAVEQVMFSERPTVADVKGVDKHQNTN